MFETPLNIHLSHYKMNEIWKNKTLDQIVAEYLKSRVNLSSEMDYMQEMHCSEDPTFLLDAIEIDENGCIGYSKPFQSHTAVQKITK